MGPASGGTPISQGFDRPTSSWDFTECYTHGRNDQTDERASRCKIGSSEANFRVRLVYWLAERTTRTQHFYTTDFGLCSKICNFAERSSVVVNKEYQNLFPAKIASRLTRWSRSTYEDFRVCYIKSHVVFTLPDTETDRETDKKRIV